MSVRVIFNCSGCGKTEPGTGPIRKVFRSFSGRDYGFGRAVYENTIEDVVPDGWMAYDPWTQCTYCPECWKSVLTPEEEERKP